ncbi:MAG: acyl carrier protein [Clostridia bacterium]|nr:acyl carrier protein [Clostridia bacterium]
MDIRETIRKEIEYIAQLEDGELGYDDNLAEYGIDSFAAVQLIAMLENKYGISVPDEKAAEMKSVNAIAKIIEDIKNE